MATTYELKPCKGGCGLMMVVFPDDKESELSCIGCNGNGAAKCCETCAHYQDDRSYEDPYGAVYCDECNNVEYFKNWPFKNGCKRWELKSWLYPMTDEELNAMNGVDG